MTVQRESDEDLGGCDNRYLAATCVWGSDPDPVFLELARQMRLDGAEVLDAGCGEGRHAEFLARQGTRVHGTDVSAMAVERARQAIGDVGGRIRWSQADLRTMRLDEASLDGVVAISVVHWLRDLDEVSAVLAGLRAATRPGGWHVLSSFNDRVPYERTTTDTRDPYLPSHSFLLESYAGWKLALATDTDMNHGHPGHEEQHSHAITELIAVRPE